MRVAKLLDEPLEHNGHSLGIFSEIVEGEFGDATTGDRVTARLTISAESAMWRSGLVRELRTLAFIDDDEELFQYRIFSIDKDRADGRIVIAGSWLGLDLGRTIMRAVVGDVPTVTLSFISLTLTEIINAFVLPAMSAMGLGYFTVGTITPTVRLSMSWQAQSPLWLLQQIATATQSELWLTRDPGVSMQINIGTRGIAAAKPLVIVGNNVATLKQKTTAGQKFFNRVYPVGTLVEGDTEDSHMGQHAMRVTGVATNTFPTPDVVAIDNPEDSTSGPIAFDDQVNGKIGYVSQPGIPFEEFSGARGFTIDTVRKRLVTTSFNAAAGADRIVWQDIQSGDRGIVDVGGGATVLREIHYHAASDAYYVTCNDIDAVKKLDAGSFTVLATITVNNQPARLTFVPNAGTQGVLVVFPDDFASQPQAINPATDTVICTFALPVTAGFVMGSGAVVYDTITARYFLAAAIINSSDMRAIVACHGTTGASLNVQSIGSFGSDFLCGLGFDPGIGFGGSGPSHVYLFLNHLAGGQFRTIDPGTYVISGPTSVIGEGTMTTLFRTVGWVAVIEPGSIAFPSTHLFGAIVLGLANNATSPAVFKIDLQTAAASLRTYVGGNTLSPSISYCHAARAFVGVDASTLTVAWVVWLVGQVIYVPYPMIALFIQDSRTSGNAFDCEGGSAVLVVRGEHVEFRENAGFSYMEALTDPVSVATYGLIDARPSMNVVAKRNYFRDGLLQEWNANDRHPLIGTSNPGAADFATRWKLADAPSAEHTGDITCAVNGAVTGPYNTVAVDGLPATAILQPGDVLRGSTFEWIVRRRAQATAGAIASLLIWPIASGTVADNTALQWYAPRFVLDEAQTDVLVASSSGSTIDISVSTPVLAIVGQSVALLVIKGYARMKNGAPSGMQLTYPGGTLNPSDATTYTDYSLQPFELAAQVQLDGVGTWIPARFNASKAAAPVVYITRVAVYLHPSLNTALIQKRASVGDGNLLWANANRLLGVFKRSTPTSTVDASAIEVPELSKITVGGYIDLRDPDNANAFQPRVIEARRLVGPPNERKRLPVLVLDSPPETLLDSIITQGS